MAYLASQLVTRAWYLSNIVARGLETVGGENESDGLQLFNELLAFKASDAPLIPYYKVHDFNTTIGIDKYTIDNLVELQTLTFRIDSVYFPMQELSRMQYFGGGRLLNTQGLPVFWHDERVKGGTDIYLYFIPQQVFPMQLTGKFALASAEADTDLEETYDVLYIHYLKYALAEYMCEWQGVSFPPQNEKKLAEIVKKLKYLSPPDLRVTKRSSIGQIPGINYGDLTWGKGWRPSIA